MVQIAELRIICMEIKVSNAIAINVPRKMPIVELSNVGVATLFTLLERQAGCF